MNGDERYLAPDDPLVKAVAQRRNLLRRGQSEERVLPPLDVLDWWEHPGEEGRTTPTGLVGVPRQLVVTTKRVLVLRDGSVDRRAVLVHSGGENPTVWGCWSMATEEAERLMGDIFQLSHGLPLEM